MVSAEERFMHELGRAVRGTAVECRKYNKKHRVPEAEWYTYESTLNAEIYHRLRNAGYRFDDLDMNQTFGTRKHADIAYIADSRKKEIAVQVVPYRNTLNGNKKQLDDVKMLLHRSLSGSNMIRVFIFVDLDYRNERKFSEKMNKRSKQLKRKGIRIISC